VVVETSPKEEPWYAVRCVFAFGPDGDRTYEERVTIWRADSFDRAIERAELEAAEYAETLDAEYLGFAQAFHLAVDDRPLESGDEVFSLMRDSTLSANDYISAFFATGTESETRSR
jgi:hypothetical protein